MARGQAGRRTRWDDDNRLSLNPWPFVVIVLFLGAIIGLGVLLSFL